MTKRRVAWVGVAAAVAALIGVGLLLLRAAPRETVTEENCKRVVKGMTLAEVESIFGRPADSVPAMFPEPSLSLAEWIRVKNPVTMRIWYGREHVAFVTFDGDSKVIWTDRQSSEPEPWYRQFAGLLGL